MKLRWGIVLATACCGIGLALCLSAPQAVASGSAVGAAGDGVVLFAMPAGDHEYVGSKSCKKCHIKVHKSWAKTKMAQAFDSLKPGQDAEIKKQHGLDPNKDYTKDEACLKCHVTGFGEKGGYAIPDAADEKAVKDAKAMEGVGCESCHGPGDKYTEVFKEIQKSKRNYKPDELYAVGLKKMDASTCTGCHNDKSPTYDASKPFDYEKQKNADTHEHEELKQREG